MVECFGAELDIDWYINELRDNVKDTTNAEFFDALDKMLKNVASVNEATEIFEIAVNVKSYTSMKDLAIEGENTFAWRVPALKAAGIEGLGE